MRKVTAVVAVLAMTVSCSATWAANVTTINEMHQQNSGIPPGSMTQFPQSHLFDGIELTEQQRQQLRDLMQQARHEGSIASLNDAETLYELTTADRFDEAAYRARLQQIANADIGRQLEFARVRNQMYHLLNRQQQAALERNHQQRMAEMRELGERLQASTLQAASSTGSNP